MYKSNSFTHETCRLIPSDMMRKTHRDGLRPPCAGKRGGSHADQQLHGRFIFYRTLCVCTKGKKPHCVELHLDVLEDSPIMCQSIT